MLSSFCLENKKHRKCDALAYLRGYAHKLADTVNGMRTADLQSLPLAPSFSVCEVFIESGAKCCSSGNIPQAVCGVKIKKHRKCDALAYLRGFEPRTFRVGV